jgi:hypothetical protein
MKPLPMSLVWECPACRTANAAGMPRCAHCGRKRPIFGLLAPDPPQDTTGHPKPPKTGRKSDFRQFPANAAVGKNDKS